MSVGSVNDLLLAACLHLADALHPRVHGAVDIGMHDLPTQLLHLLDQGQHLMKMRNKIVTIIFDSIAATFNEKYIICGNDVVFIFFKFKFLYMKKLYLWTIILF